MAESEDAASVALYQYLCRYIVGREEDVKTIRLMNIVNDEINTYDSFTYITSGSFGEGLKMKGSDLDIMIVLRDICVYETANTYPSTSFVMDTEETKPGFTLLRLMQTTNPLHYSWCIELFNKSNLFLSNINFKATFCYGINKHVHGPCLSDKNQLHDIAFCLHSKCWISQAKKWVTRSNNSWPSETVKQTIIDHGVLFVPVGIKGSPNEEAEWRISFSVGEKFLIYTFNHTQLICYALIKIFLKDVIEADNHCKGLLCSYYLKNILFWVSEEIPSFKWSSNNLIHCFIGCFQRLIYCVKYSLCPHYFIPENNLFENKIEANYRDILLERLNILHSYGWRCILVSNQFSDFRLECLRMNSIDKTEELNRIKLYEFFSVMLSVGNYEKSIKLILSYKSSILKHCGIYFLSSVCLNESCSTHIKDTSNNKEQYKEYRTCLSYILQNIETDAVSRWLLLSSLFYRMKQYGKSLGLLSYTLSKCTPDKIYCHSGLLELLDWPYYFLNLKLSKHVFRLMKFININAVCFLKQSSFIPNELGSIYIIPPVVYAHFLRFLCFYHLGNDRQCVDAIKQLLLTIKNKYFIGGIWGVSYSYNCAGIALQLLGDYDLARQCYMAAAEYDSPLNCALQRLQFLNEST